MIRCAVQAAVGCSVTLKCNTRRRSYANTMNTYSTRKVAVGTVRKSIETNSRKWLSRNVRQVCDGGFLPLGISRETDLSEISIPSLSNSPWMRGAPHSGLACVICLIRALIWELAEGRPPIFRRDSLVQKSRKPLRCQPMTVSGLTMSKEARHSSQIRDNQTQNTRSFVLITDRFWVRFRMASCCRKARFSRAKLHRPLSVALKKQHSKDSNSLIPIEVSRSAVKSQRYQWLRGFGEGQAPLPKISSALEILAVREVISHSASNAANSGAISTA